MPRITDTLLDDEGRPLANARVTIDILLSPQVPPGDDGSSGIPAKRQLIWRGATDRNGVWFADLPAQSRWGESTFYTASVNHHGRGVSTRDEFIVTEDAGEGLTQKVRDRPVPGRKRRPRPSNPERPIPIST